MTPLPVDFCGIAIYVLDTEVCDIVENALVSWGVEKQWIENAYGCLEDVLFEEF